MCVPLDREEGSKDVQRESLGKRNPYMIVSVILGFLTGLNAVLVGSGFYYAGWPAHGPVSVLGIFLGLFGLLTILGSLFVLEEFARRRSCFGLDFWSPFKHVGHVRLDIRNDIDSAYPELHLCNLCFKMGP